mmetsp:Transcript_7553/g.25437  ORF Transcript_7553/g.25437 Transcript_7553/m.25437 type:complete len:237 (+) Transcript_7553:1448-2158(+)
MDFRTAHLFLQQSERVFVTVQIILQLLRILGLLGGCLGRFERSLRARLGIRQGFFSALQRVKFLQNVVALARTARNRTARVDDVAFDGDALETNLLVKRHCASRGGVLAHECLAENVFHHRIHVLFVRDERQSERGVAVTRAVRRFNLVLCRRDAGNLVQRNNSHALGRVLQELFTSNFGVGDDLIELTTSHDVEGGCHRRILHAHQLGHDALDVLAVKLGLGILEFKVHRRELGR